MDATLPRPSTCVLHVGKSNIICNWSQIVPNPKPPLSQDPFPPKFKNMTNTNAQLNQQNTHDPDQADLPKHQTHRNEKLNLPVRSKMGPCFDFQPNDTCTRKQRYVAPWCRNVIRHMPNSNIKSNKLMRCPMSLRSDHSSDT